MNIIALPLLFNGLFFSLSPSAVHNGAPGKEAAVLNYTHPATGYTLHEPKTLFTPAVKMVRVQVNFYMNEKRELQVISVNSPVPGINNMILQNINLLMPQVRNYFTVNTPYTITLELKDDSVS